MLVSRRKKKGRSVVPQPSLSPITAPTRRLF
jgi:hypothetical protein